LPCTDGSTEALGTSELTQLAFWDFNKIETRLFRTSAVFWIESFFVGVWSEAQLNIRKVELKIRNLRKLRRDIIKSFTILGMSNSTHPLEVPI
jgi:hypothetical protein